VRGYLRITDRKKGMFISGGFNLYPAVAMVAVIGVPDERLGEVGRALVVWTTTSGTDEAAAAAAAAAAAEAALIAWSGDHMANYKVSRSVAFVDNLPRNPAGKVLKTELRG